MYNSIKICFVILIGLLSCCCTKKDCFSFYETKDIYFKGFQISELDSFVMETYKANTNFLQRIDSAAFTYNANVIAQNEYLIFLPQAYAKNTDYKLTIISTNQTFKIYGFTTNEESCNNCPTNPNDKVNYLTSYKVNNVFYSDGRITITK